MSLVESPENDLRGALEEYLIALGMEVERISNLVRLTGGSSRETWQLTVLDGSNVAREFILRRDPPGAEDPARMAREAAALVEAEAAMVPVSRLIGHSADRPSVDVGQSFLLMNKLQGEALPRRLYETRGIPRFAVLCPTSWGVRSREFTA
jgi:aminoglycoside phosphotransferase (APT) family kinase protein